MKANLIKSTPFDLIIDVLLLYCGVLGLSFSTDDTSLKEAFSGFGDVTDGKCSLGLLPEIHSSLYGIRVLSVSFVDNFGGFF